MLDYPGRPALSTVDNNGASPRPALLEYLPPVQTAPFDLLHCTGTGSGTFDSRSNTFGIAFEPRWEEELLVDAPLQELVQQDALLLLELLQLPSSFHRYNVSAKGAVVSHGMPRQGYSMPRHAMDRPCPMPLRCFWACTSLYVPGMRPLRIG